MGRKPAEEDPPDWSYVAPLEDEVDPEFELEPEPPHEEVIQPRLFGNGEQVPYAGQPPDTPPNSDRRHRHLDLSALPGSPRSPLSGVLQLYYVPRRERRPGDSSALCMMSLACLCLSLCRCLV